MGKRNLDLPEGLSKPALRALSAAGITRLDQLAKRSEAELLKFHGMGTKSIRQIREAFAREGLSFSDHE
jgi:DNA-directed RNA polymerase alpha subunit